MLPFSFFVLLAGICVFPFLALILKAQVSYGRFFKIFRKAIIFFVVHNVLFLVGVSLKGDYIDYTIFALEYLLLLWGLFNLFRSTKLWVKVLASIGSVVVITKAIIGIMICWIMPAICQEFEANKYFHFKATGKTYETRRYSFGTVGGLYARYTFETFRTFGYLPLEYKIDETTLRENDSTLSRIGENSLVIDIQKTDGKKTIEFCSTNGYCFRKTIK